MLNSRVVLQIKFGFHSGKTHGVHINQAACGGDFSEGCFCFLSLKGFPEPRSLQPLLERSKSGGDKLTGYIL